ncbi:unnamed protein product, partial [Didymodactylos carnosus]
LMRRYLVWPAGMIFPNVILKCAILRMLHENKNNEDSNLATWKMGQLRFFLILLIIQFVYYWIPGYFMPILTSFSLLCFMYQKNIVFGQLTGFYGLGMGALQLDWQSVTAFLQSPILYPWWALFNILIGFIGIYWIIVPILYYTNTMNAKVLPIFSDDSYARDGSSYNYSLITDGNMRLNQTAYEQYGGAMLTPAFTVTFCIQFAVITSIIVHTILYHGKDILKQFNMSADEASNDVHGALMAKLAKEVPEYWYTFLFVSLFVCGALVCQLSALMPWYYLFVIISIDFILLLPGGIVKAITNQDIDLDLLMSFLGGLVLKGNAIANMTFRTYGYTIQRRSLTFISCLKLGHYMKIPPRAMFTMLVVNTLIGSTRARDWWIKYSYIFSAAMSAGVGAALIIIAFIPVFPVDWWGNAQNELDGDGCRYSTADFSGTLDDGTFLEDSDK